MPVNGYPIGMKNDENRESYFHSNYTMRESIMQSSTGSVARSRIQRAVIEGRSYGFIADAQTQGFFFIGSGISMDTEKSCAVPPTARSRNRLHDINIDMLQNICAAIMTGAEKESLTGNCRRVLNALSITRQALEEFGGYGIQDQYFVFIREIPEAPVFHHFVPRCRPFHGPGGSGTVAPGSVFHFGLTLFDVIHQHILRGDEELYRMFKELLLLEQRAVLTGHLHCKIMLELIEALVEASLFDYQLLPEKQLRETFKAAV
jgi:hypothetical protein